MMKNKVLATIISCAMMVCMFPENIARADSLTVDITMDTEFVRHVFCGTEQSYYDVDNPGAASYQYTTATADEHIHVAYNGSVLGSSVFMYIMPDSDPDPNHRLINVFYKTNDLSLHDAGDSVNVCINGVALRYSESNQYVNVYRPDSVAGLSVSFSISTDYGIMLGIDASFLRTVEMYRLYNTNSGEHFYTANAGERDFLVSLGWRDEGIGWIAPNMSNVPVYRLYNPNGGEHHYTTSAGERNGLIAMGWNDEGIGWYSSEGMGWYSDASQTTPLQRYTTDPYVAAVLTSAGWRDVGGGWYSGDIPKTALYRQYNPNAFANNHNYTTSLGENDWLVSIGWRPEGIGWYGVG